MKKPFLKEQKEPLNHGIRISTRCIGVCLSHSSVGTGTSFEKETLKQRKKMSSRKAKRFISQKEGKGGKLYNRQLPSQLPPKKDGKSRDINRPTLTGGTRDSNPHPL